jgi:hypothetical protein
MAANQAKPALPESVLSRALLLLRLATSMNNNNFGQAGLQTLDDLEFWWPQYGSERGFYDSDVPPDDLSDLWSDVEIALDDLKNVTSATSFDLARLAIPSFGRVCEADRAVLWALIR